MSNQPLFWLNIMNKLMSPWVKLYLQRITVSLLCYFIVSVKAKGDFAYQQEA